MFDVDPSQIEALHSTDLVLLLHKLLHAEAMAAGIQLGGISVPMQITVPDGGEDGRIEWHGGRDTTAYLPGRACFFQSKASKIGRAGWKKECWTKSSQPKGKARVITPALKSIIDQKGCYIGFTTEALTGPRRDEYIRGIREGITEAQCNPDGLAIDIYDANKIAAWATRHSAVSIWLGERFHRQSLAAFRTIEGWASLSDFMNIPFQEDTDARFSIGSLERDETGADNDVTARVAWDRVLKHLEEPHRLVRVTGSSGLGKSRFVFESLRSSKSLLAEIFRSSTVFVDYRSVAGSLLQVASSLAETGNRILLVVDECPRDVAIELGKSVMADTSGLVAITIDTDDRPTTNESVVQITLRPSGGALVEAIIRSRVTGIGESAVARLRDICGGFPRFAVLAAGSQSFGPSNLESENDVVDRILVGASMSSEAELRALQCLSMFEQVAVEGDGNAPPLDFVANGLARMSGDEMYEHLAKARQHDLVGQRGDLLSAQPLPIAINLAFRRLKLLRPSSLYRFLGEASDALTASLLRRWRWLDTSPVVIEAASRLLYSGERLGSKEAILSPGGSSLIDALVDILPDRVAERLDYLIGGEQGWEATLGRESRRSLVEALSKLVFRSRSFDVAARLLLRLAANEMEDWANNATGIFKQLFQLHLSGTVVPPASRFAVLDEGMDNGEVAIQAVCVDALASIFNTQYVRFGDTGSIGSGEPLKDWSPNDWNDVHEFRREGLRRLAAFRRSHVQFAEKCEHILAGAARLMLSSDLYEEYGEILVGIAREKGSWPEAVEGVGDWLYYDRNDMPAGATTYARKLYDRLFPSDPVDQAILFTKFWQSDIRDPDFTYVENEHDFEYSISKSLALADRIASDRELALDAVRRMAGLDLKTLHPFAQRLGQVSNDRRELFEASLQIVAEANGNIGMLRGLLRGIDLFDHDLADECVAEALIRLDGKAAGVDIHSAVSIDANRLARFVEDLCKGTIKPADAVYLSYGQGLNDVDIQNIIPLFDELLKHGGDGAWAALEIALMYKHGQPMSDALARQVAEILISPGLFDGRASRARDAHLLDDLVRRVRHVIGFDARTAEGLSAQVIRLAQSQDYGTLSTLNDVARDMVVLLRMDAPATLWSNVSRFFEVATPIERGRLRRIVGPAERFDGETTAVAGPLFGVPTDLVLAWADDSEERQNILLDFFPLLQKEDEGLFWHPALEEICKKYGKSKSFRTALSRRMRPTSWSGSIVPYLDLYLRPLQSWFEHPVRPLAVWAKDQFRRLELQIEYESARDKA